MGRNRSTVKKVKKGRMVQYNGKQKVKKDENWLKYVQMDQKATKWIKIGPNGSIIFQICPKGSKGVAIGKSIKSF